MALGATPIFIGKPGPPLRLTRSHLTESESTEGDDTLRSWPIHNVSQIVPRAGGRCEASLRERLQARFRTL